MGGSHSLVLVREIGDEPKLARKLKRLIRPIARTPKRKPQREEFIGGTGVAQETQKQPDRRRTESGRKYVISVSGKTERDERCRTIEEGVERPIPFACVA